MPRKKNDYREYEFGGKTVKVKTIDTNLVRCLVPDRPNGKLLEKIQETLQGQTGIDTVILTPNDAFLLRINLEEVHMSFDKFMNHLSRTIITVIMESSSTRASLGSIPQASRQQQPALTRAALAAT